MEDVLSWTDLVASFAFEGVDSVDERITEMWAHLQPAVVYFMRFLGGQHKAEHIATAQDHLLQYAKLAEQHFGMHELLTYQLHVCLVHVAEQAHRCGPTAFAAEWWVERLMQVFKRIVKYRSTRYPEAVAVNHWLAVQALRRIEWETPGATALYKSLQPRRNMQAASGYDDTSGTCWLSGVLKSAREQPGIVRSSVLPFPARLQRADALSLRTLHETRAHDSSAGAVRADSPNSLSARASVAWRHV